MNFYTNNSVLNCHYPYLFPQNHKPAVVANGHTSPGTFQPAGAALPHSIILHYSEPLLRTLDPPVVPPNPRDTPRRRSPGRERIELALIPATEHYVPWNRPSPPALLNWWGGLTMFELQTDIWPFSSETGTFPFWEGIALVNEFVFCVTFFCRYDLQSVQRIC